jgi:hypothetical protein
VHGQADVLGVQDQPRQSAVGNEDGLDLVSQSRMVRCMVTRSRRKTRCPNPLRAAGNKQ